jgi:hypothetical protein
MNDTLTALKSKTVRFGILLAVLSVLQGFIGLINLTQVQQAIAGSIIAAAIIVLRAVTNQPLLSK